MQSDNFRADELASQTATGIVGIRTRPPPSYIIPPLGATGGVLFCCPDMAQAIGREVIAETEKHLIDDGRILNDIDSTYFLRSGDESGRFSYFALNYCPFCGRAISRGLWVAEKKK